MIQDDCNIDRKVILCDSAYANGGDLQLLQFLDDLKVIDRITAYAGWNTNCNTLGTALAVAMTSEQIPVHNILYRIIEDCFYQSRVRMQVVQKDRQDEVEKRIGSYLLENYKKLQISRKYPIAKIHVCMPWRRMFEIGMKIDWE